MSQDTRDKFESLLLAGRSRENPIVSSLLDRGTDGEYFNANTRAAFAWFVKGLESVVVVLPDDGLEDCQKAWGERCKNTFDCGYNFASLRHEQAIEAAGGKVAE